MSKNFQKSLITITKRAEIFSESYFLMGNFIGFDSRNLLDMITLELPHTEPTRGFNVLDKIFKSGRFVNDPEAFTHVVHMDQLLSSFSVRSKKSRHVLWIFGDDR